MINRLVVFNTWHLGDMHVGKEFVRKFFDVAERNNVPYFYATDKNNHALNLPVNFLSLDQCDPAVRNCPPSFYSHDGTFYANIWVGHYMIAQQHNIVNQIPMWQDIAVKLIANSGGQLIPSISNDPWEFVPEINEELLSPMNVPEGKKVLICNNPSVSLPTFQTNLYEPISRLADEFPNVNFVCTLNMGLVKPNVCYTENIITNQHGNDLPEIGHLAKYCDVIASNSSGPGTFIINKTVLSDASKRIISFSPAYENTLWAGVGAVAQTSWEPDASDQNFYEKVRDALNA